MEGFGCPDEKFFLFFFVVVAVLISRTLSSFTMRVIPRISECFCTYLPRRFLLVQLFSNLLIYLLHLHVLLMSSYVLCNNKHATHNAHRTTHLPPTIFHKPSKYSVEFPFAYLWPTRPVTATNLISKAVRDSPQPHARRAFARGRSGPVSPARAEETCAHTHMLSVGAALLTCMDGDAQQQQHGYGYGYG